MEELIQAIEKLSQKTIIDYLIIIVPIIVSIVALIISIVVASRQNKIALLEKRCYVLSQIRTMANFSFAIRNSDNKNHIFTFFDSFYGTNICDKSDKEQFVQASAKLESLKNDVMQAEFLFEIGEVDLEETVNQLKLFIAGLALGNKYKEEQEKFCELCQEFHDKDYNKMAKVITLTKPKFKNVFSKKEG